MGKILIDFYIFPEYNPKVSDFVLSLKDKDGIPILLGKKEWESHILDKHPEVKDFLKEIAETVKNPDIRYIDSEDPSVCLHYKYIPNSRRVHEKLRYMLVIIKYVLAPEFNYEKTGFISSIYFLKEPKKRRKE